MKHSQKIIIIYQKWNLSKSIIIEARREKNSLFLVFLLLSVCAYDCLSCFLLLFFFFLLFPFIVYK